MTARLLVDIENLPPELKEKVAQFASVVTAADARHIASTLESVDDEEQQATLTEIIRKAEQRDEHRHRMERAISGAEPLPSLGSFPRPQQREVVAGPDAWLQGDPRRVGLVAQEMVALDGILDDDALAALLTRAQSLGLDPRIVLDALSKEIA